jgi:radical SAM superfamily enzyme YgiQ (UPF0313 family)
MSSKPLVLLVQLPIPLPGPEPVRGNVPLAAAYLKLFGRQRGLEEKFEIAILPARLANTLGDQGLVAEILDRRPWLVGFTCFVWNVERVLWVAGELKRRDPDVKVVLGGPEITADNAWVLGHPAVDYAVIGEGEQTFTEMLGALAPGHATISPIAGLWVGAGEGDSPIFAARKSGQSPLLARRPLASLDEVAGVYLEGILDAAEERLMFLETVRGCVYKCKFCYYPKSFEGLTRLGPGQIAASLSHARAAGVEEVFLLDPTLNQRRDFADFLRLLARGNPDRQFTFSGELRAEGIRSEHARLMREANFAEVEIGLQSVDPTAQDLMNRKVPRAAFERGVRALLDEGIRVRVDLIVGLPGDTADSVRRGIDYLLRTGLYGEVQVFNLSILPGTPFREEAEPLGLSYQPRPPYYVLQTPTLRLEEMVDLVEEVQEAFGIEFDPLAPLDWDLLMHGAGTGAHRTIDLDAAIACSPLPDQRPAQCLTLWLRSRDFALRREEAVRRIREVLDSNPHTTLHVVLEPGGRPERLSVATLAAVQHACYASTSYLDRYYSLHPGNLLGAKRITVLVPGEARPGADPTWLRETADFATLAWHGPGPAAGQLARHECLVPETRPSGREQKNTSRPAVVE